MGCIQQSCVTFRGDARHTRSGTNSAKAQGRDHANNKGGTYGEEARMARNVGDAADDGSGGIGTIDSGPAEGQPKSRGKAADRGDRHHGELRPAAGEGTQSLGWTGAVWESVARRRR